MSDTETPYRDQIAFLNARISYLQGNGRALAPPGPIPAEAVFVPGTRYEFEIEGIGREEKEAPLPPSDPRVWRLPFEDFLAGAYTYRIPIAYRISLTAARGLTLSMGTWSREVGGDDKCVRR